MTAITIFNGCFCDARPVVQRVAEITGYRLVEDEEIIADAAGLSGLNPVLIAGLFRAEEGLCGLNGPDRDRIISWLRYAIARKLARDEDLLFWGYTALLAPRDCGNILGVCLVNDQNDRLWAACRDGERTEPEAREHMAADDRMRGEWIVDVTDCNDPWSEDLYDMIVPVSALGVRQSAYLIVEQLANTMVRDSSAARMCMQDFLLASRVQVELARHGHDVTVAASRGNLTLSLNNHASTLRNGTRILFEEVSDLKGVRGVEIGTGQRYNPNDVLQRTAVPLPDAPVEDAECSGGRAEDAALSNKVRAHLPYADWGVSVFVRDGFVSLTVNDHARLLDRMARRVCGLAADVLGVESVEFGIGRNYHQGAACARIRRKRCREILADVRRKFVPTLSPRLRQHGDVGSFALYDGKNAFYTMDEHEPEVVVLDMPGAHGGDVLRRFKREHPETEVLVLSGREAAPEAEECMSMGAFACLKKPVDSAALTETIRAACEKYRSCS